jgi:hypothetical protein
MRRSVAKSVALSIIVLLPSVLLISCFRNDEPSRYPNATFPDSILALTGINSQYDDYNSSGYQSNGMIPLIFSSNRKSLGGEFDLEQGEIDFSWNKSTGIFSISSMITTDPFYASLIEKNVTPRNDFGPFRIFNTDDGLEYTIVASQTESGDLDLKYCKYQPYYHTENVPQILGPYPVTLINSPYDDAYLSFDLNLDTAYFASNPGGNFDIFYKVRPPNTDVGEWFNQAYSSSSTVDSINSAEDDKCPVVLNNLMLFASNREGGYGGFDLYYSLYKNGKWNSPVNMGSRINTSDDEYRPLIGTFPNFSNYFIIFSSNRPKGKGGFDLYFTGLTKPVR